MKLHIYRAKDGWRWRLKARNGRIMADSGQAYSTKFKCKFAWWKIRVASYTADVVFDIPKDGDDTTTP